MSRLLLCALLLGCRPRIPPPPIEATPPAPPQIPAPARAAYLEGWLQLEHGELEAADAAFERASRFDPRSPEIPLARARVALVAGDAAALTAGWALALDRDPAVLDEPAIQQIVAFATRHEALVTAIEAGRALTGRISCEEPAARPARRLWLALAEAHGDQQWIGSARALLQQGCGAIDPGGSRPGPAPELPSENR